MSDLAEDLRHWADRAEPVRAEAAAARGRSRRRRRRRITGVAGGLGAAGLAVVVVAVAPFPGDEGLVRTDDPARTTDATAQDAPPDGGIPGITATVTASDLGPLAVTIGPIVEYPPDGPLPGGWAQHEIRLENTGDIPLMVESGEAALTGPTYLGDGMPPLHAGDDNCSFLWDATLGWQSECLAHLRGYEAPPAGTATMPMYLYRAPNLEPGTYTFARRIRWYEPAPAPVHNVGTVEVTYTVTDAAG